MNSILLVDDEPIICAELQRTLSALGLRVETAFTVEAARRLARKTQFDAILVEFNVKSEREGRPRSGNGVELVRQLRMSRFGIPILMYTAMEGELYEMASLDAGADEFIQKTCSSASLASRIRAHIRRHEQRSESGQIEGIYKSKSKRHRETHMRAATK